MKLFFATLLMLGLPATALAQSVPGNDIQTGSRFKREVKTYDEGAARNIQKKVAKCVAYMHKDLARELLQKSDPTQIDYDALSVEPGDLFDKLDVDECIGRSMPASAGGTLMRFDAAVMRNLLAEEVYLMDYKGPLALTEDAPEAVEERYIVGGMGDQRTAMMVNLADCIVKREPVAAHEFIDTQPGSKKEAKSVVALHEAIDACAQQKVSSNLDTGLVRRIVADGLWTRAYHLSLSSETAAAPAEGGE